MEDFNLSFASARSAAMKAMRKPLVLKVLAMILSDIDLPFQVSQKSAARLLDIVILSGNKEAAAALARKNPVRPLRRWNIGDMFGTLSPSWGVQLTHYSQQSPVLLAALHAGATFKSIFLLFCRANFLESAPLPLRESVFALGWPIEAFAGLLPNSKSPWNPESFNDLGRCLCTRPWVVSLDRLHEATVHGIDVKDWLIMKSATNARVGSFSLSLLDLSIVKGLADCAAACAGMGMRVRDVELCREATVGEVQCDRLVEFGFTTWDADEADGLIATEESCLGAATAAGRAALKASWRRESPKGIPIYQLMKLASGRSTEPLVNQVLLFSMEVPELIDQLSLWDDVAGWQDDLVEPPSAAAGATASESNAYSTAAAELPDIASALPQFVQHQHVSTLCKIIKLANSKLLFGILLANGFEIRALDRICTRPKNIIPDSGSFDYRLPQMHATSDKFLCPCLFL